MVGWCLINRLPTRDLLNRRGINIPIESQICVLCQRREETLEHFLLNCSVSKLFWRELSERIEVPSFLGDGLKGVICGGTFIVSSKR